MTKKKWKFSKEWEKKVRDIVNAEIGKSEGWIKRLIQEEFQKIEAARGSR